MKNREWYKKRVKNYEVNSEIEEGLASQMDIVEMIKWNRVFKFLTIVSLRKNQAQLVKYFRDYSLQTSQGSKVKGSVDNADMEMEELLRGFRP